MFHSDRKYTLMGNHLRLGSAQPGYYVDLNCKDIFYPFIYFCVSCPIFNSGQQHNFCYDFLEV